MQITKRYIKYSVEQLEKIGNAAVFLATEVPGISKTKLLNLLYILDELSIKQSGLPFFNLQYKVWKFGPVAEELFVDLSSEITLLKKYIAKKYQMEGEHEILEPVTTFSDDEFSENDIDLLNLVIEKFGDQTAKELVQYTHRVNSPWYNSAKENGLLHLLESEQQSASDVIIDMSQLVAHDPRKMAIYNSYQEMH